MKTTFIIISVCILLNACSNKIIPAATPVTNFLTSDSKGTPMLLGHCTPAAMLQQPFSQWYDSAYKAYQPDLSQVADLKQQLANTEIEVFLGTWCGDSRRELPRLLKTLNESGVDTNKIHIILVDHEGAAYKQSPQHEEKGKYIFRVPTAIIYKNKQELGRVIESPVESWGKDLLKITQGQSYEPNYAAAYDYMKQANRKTDEQTLSKMKAQYQPVLQSAGMLNSVGYLFLHQKETAKAMQAFTLNTLLFPADSNTWDSLAEAYADAGNTAKAIELYKKVLALKPGHLNATERLKKLGAAD